MLLSLGAKAEDLWSRLCLVLGKTITHKTVFPTIDDCKCKWSYAQKVGDDDHETILYIVINFGLSVSYDWTGASLVGWHLYY